VSECFVEFTHDDGLLLLLSKIILIVPSVGAALLTVVVVGFYIWDVFVLPIKTVEVLMAWYLPHFTRYALHNFVSFVTDIVSYGHSWFLAMTFVSNYISIFNFFITDSIEKLK